MHSWQSVKRQVVHFRLIHLGKFGAIWSERNGEFRGESGNVGRRRGRVWGGDRMTFFVGLHQPSDAKHFENSFISVNRLRRRKSAFAVGDWIMDSGAFSTLATHGDYPYPVSEYAEQVRRWEGSMGDSESQTTAQFQTTAKEYAELVDKVKHAEGEVRRAQGDLNRLRGHLEKRREDLCRHVGANIRSRCVLLPDKRVVVVRSGEGGEAAVEVFDANGEVMR